MPGSAPSAIRHESYGLETYSPYQNADLTDFDIFDSGDLELCFGSSESALADIEGRAAEILAGRQVARCCWAANIWSRWEPCGLR